MTAASGPIGDAARGWTDPPVHLRPRYLALVGAGGVAGTAAREGLSLVITPPTAFPVAVFAINLAGAFVLGLLLESLARRGPDEGGRRQARLLLGTGFCGGFTTYSSLAAATAVLLAQGDPGTAIGYALATLVLGALAAAAGIACGGVAGGRR